MNMLSRALYKNLLLSVIAVVVVSIFADGRARRRDGALEVVGTKHNIISDCFSSTNSTTLDTVVSDPDKFLSSLDLDNIKCGEFKCLARDPNASGVGYLISSNDPDLQFEAEIKCSWMLAEYIRDELLKKNIKQYLCAP